MPRIMRTHTHPTVFGSRGRRGAPGAPASRAPRRHRFGNRHAELLILCARIGFNP